MPARKHFATNEILRGAPLRRLLDAHEHIKRRHSVKSGGDAMLAYDRIEKAITDVSTELNICPDILLSVVFNIFKTTLNVIVNNREYDHEHIVVSAENFLAEMKRVLKASAKGGG